MLIAYRWLNDIGNALDLVDGNTSVLEQSSINTDSDVRISKGLEKQILNDVALCFIHDIPTLCALEVAIVVD